MDALGIVWVARAWREGDDFSPIWQSKLITCTEDVMLWSGYSNSTSASVFHLLFDPLQRPAPLSIANYRILDMDH
jgi:hypothetical protein